jgi:predicted dehydrogenase
MKTIRWGMIGCGDVTEVKSGPGFQKANHSALVAVMRRNGDLARDYAERHGVPRWYDDAEALINDPEVDAVYIATPTYAHRDYTLMAAKAKKPVYVEKPMAMSFAECCDMVEACQSAGVPLWVAYYRRTLPRFVKIKALIDSGELGDIRSVVIRLYMRPLKLEGDIPWRFLPEISGGGKFIDMGVHTLDFLDYVLGPIKIAQGIAVNQAGLYPAEDHVVANFAFESGAIGVGDWCFSAAVPKDEVVIVGTKGELAFSSFDTTPLTLTNDAGTVTFAIDNPPHVQQPLIQTIVDELNGVGTCPSSGNSGARTTAITDQILRGYQPGM